MAFVVTVSRHFKWRDSGAQEISRHFICRDTRNERACIRCGTPTQSRRHYALSANKTNMYGYEAVAGVEDVRIGDACMNDSKLL
jgi:hypothetical protein